MTKLSVNINKIATLRNARGGSYPNVVEAALKIQQFGADGITVHPRPDERHIKYEDVRDLKGVVHTEFNIEGYPSEKFMSLVKEVNPTQVTLVPDPPGILTSNAGWDTVKNKDMLSEICGELKKAGLRVSIFMENNLKWIEGAKVVGADRIELYTESYAVHYKEDKVSAIHAYKESAAYADSIGLGVNAGHDLNLHNLAFFIQEIPSILEVSIGHALISDALYLGMENTVQLYKGKLGVYNQV